MQISNIRFGHATNSSSSHSIVIVPPGKKAYSDYNGKEYGWDRFVLAEADEKLHYFALQFHMSIRNQFDDNVAKQWIDQWFPGVVDWQDNEYCSYDGTGNEYVPDGYIDHQSQLGLTMYNDDFMEDFINYIRSDNVAVFGGNDNSDGDGWMPDWATVSTSYNDRVANNSWISTSLSYNTRIRRDGDWYTLYQPNHGNKMRITMKDNPQPFTKASWPELVDVKITDYCPYGCSFCYQSSTKAGVHAPLDRIERVLDILREWEVFEVAIGGGEPVMHPDFIKILEMCAERNIRPNITVFGTQWLKDYDLVEAIKRYVGGIGVSVHQIKDFNKVVKIREALKPKNYSTPTMVMAQHVVGTHDVNDTAEIISYSWQNCIELLMLGFKDVGFGTNQEVHNMSTLGDAIELLLDRQKERSRPWYQLSVDTAFVDLYPNILKQLDIKEQMVSSPEGKFSMYWDAVTDRISPSSYCDAKHYVDYENPQQALKTYQSW